MNYVTSADGTRIAYGRTGSGPVIILVDGALCSRAMGPMSALAKLLSKDFTVIQYDRRGRGESSDTAPYSTDREIDDLQALVQMAGGSPAVFGISSGAVLAVKAAARGVGLGKLALYEPPVLIASQTTEHTDHVARLSTFIAAEQRSQAVQYFLKTMVGAPKPVVAIMRLLPFWSKLKAVAPTLPYDAKLTQTGSLTPEGLASIKVPALVLWGEKSPVFLKDSSKQTAAALPGAKTLELKGQTHNVSPKVLVPALKGFF